MNDHHFETNYWIMFVYFKITYVFTSRLDRDTEFQKYRLYKSSDNKNK